MLVPLIVVGQLGGGCDGGCGGGDEVEVVVMVEMVEVVAATIVVGQQGGGCGGGVDGGDGGGHN